MDRDWPHPFLPSASACLSVAISVVRCHYVRGMYSTTVLILSAPTLRFCMAILTKLLHCERDFVLSHASESSDGGIVPSKSRCWCNVPRYSPQNATRSHATAVACCFPANLGNEFRITVGKSAYVGM